MGQNTRIRMAGPKTAEILIYEDIGEGWFGGISAKSFADQLNALGKLDRINLRVNSPGGNVFDALAIYNTLVRNSARVVVDIDGMALSAASLVAMAGDEIRIAENAMMMIHDPWLVASGNADELRETADTLDKVKDNLVTTYAKRTKVPFDEVSEMLSAETWMTGAEAVEKGFADTVTEALAVAAHFDLSRFKNVPNQALSRAKDAPRPRMDFARARIREIAARATHLSNQARRAA